MKAKFGGDLLAPRTRYSLLASAFIFFLTTGSQFVEAQTPVDRLDFCAEPLVNGKAPMVDGKKIAIAHPFPALVSEISGQAWVAAASTKKVPKGDVVMQRKISAQDMLPVGTRIITGANSFLSILLSDCSRVVLPSMSDVVLREIPNGKAMVLLAGSNGNNRQVKRTQFIARFEVNTGGGEFYIPTSPTGTLKAVSKNKKAWKNVFEVKAHGTLLGVRGTHFRVKWENDGDASLLAKGRVEVLEGLVNSQKIALSKKAGSKLTPSVLLGAGAGAFFDSTSLRSAFELLPAPSLALNGLTSEVLGQRQGGILELQPVANASAYKVQVAKDDKFLAIIDERQSKTIRIGLPNLVTGQYFLRVTAISELGLEGMPMAMPWTVEARPVSVVRKTGVKVLADGRLEISWPEPTFNASTQPVSYRFEIASDPQFKSILATRSSVMTPGVTVDQLPKGNYYWRVDISPANGNEKYDRWHSGTVDAP